MNPKQTKLIFMGTPDFAVKSLRALIKEKYDVVGVFTAPDRKKGRGQSVHQSPIKVLAEENNMKVFQPDKIKNEEWVEKIRELGPDIIVVAAYGQIIPKSILEIPKYGCVNVHASLLPKYRGASPIHYALLHGKKETGITIMKMDQGMDTGDIISNFQFPIFKNDNLETLHDKLAKLGAKLLVETLPDYIDGNIEPRKQDEAGATYTGKIEKKDGRIDWNKTSKELWNMVRAFDPWPGTFTYLDGKCLKIRRVEMSDMELKPGETLVEDGKLYIGTADKALEIKKLQMEGKKCMVTSEFVKGCRMDQGYFCD
ncbi:methionyl-tRNA formyltransferase [Patescibacteria group bacterium]|nr:methionyl-tRNA formyltransferase [Patescibacteria group bacterium]